jgi:hypothetical protein
MNAAVQYATSRGRRTIVAGAWWLAAALILFAYGDEAERRFAPVLVNQVVTPLPVEAHGHDRLCWRWTFSKARSAAPVEATWTLIDNRSRRFALVPTSPNGVPPLLATAPPGFVADRIFCAVVPPAAGILDGRIEIVGAMSYQTRWSPWFVRQEFPSAVWNDGVPVR